jgi:hypothetical protein
VSTTYDETGEGFEVTLRDHDGLENDDAENEICRAESVLKRGGPSACDRRLKEGKTRSRESVRVVRVRGVVCLLCLLGGVVLGVCEGSKQVGQGKVGEVVAVAIDNRK